MRIKKKRMTLWVEGEFYLINNKIKHRHLSLLLFSNIRFPLDGKVPRECHEFAVFSACKLVPMKNGNDNLNILNVRRRRLRLRRRCIRKILFSSHIACWIVNRLCVISNKFICECVYNPTFRVSLSVYMWVNWMPTSWCWCWWQTSH